MTDDRAPTSPASAPPQGDYIDIVFDGPPSHESGRFIEVENSSGASIRFGEWVHRPDGYWVLRLRDGWNAALAASQAEVVRLKDELNKDAEHRTLTKSSDRRASKQPTKASGTGATRDRGRARHGRALPARPKTSAQHATAAAREANAETERAAGQQGAGCIRVRRDARYSVA